MKKIFGFVLLIALLVIVTGCGPNGSLQLNTPVPNQATPAPGQVTIPSANIQINAPGPNPLINTPTANGQTAGALLGLWHGFISPVTMLLSLTSPNVGMYEVHNDGGPYNLGFFLGLIGLLAILSGLVTTRRRW